MEFRVLLILADLSFEMGLIGESEYIERIRVADWLADDSLDIVDPRVEGSLESEERRTDERDQPSSDEPVKLTGRKRPEESDWFELIVLGKWLFTRSDPDPYPSTPHGHLYNANKRWPKLDPYTGRAFKAKHQEDPTLRLSKRKMRELWGSEAFRDFCRSHILWYMEAFPHHTFRVRYPLRFPRW